MCDFRHSQKVQLYQFLRRNSCSRWMAAERLGIPLQSVTRYVGQLLKEGRLWNVKRGKCAISGRMVWFISANPELRNTSQLDLFEGGDYD